ncbi:MAG: hypothetical protein ACO3EZ_13310 [Prochlorotrichaceae cyanobacterium]|jgi:hypothetical protein
MMVFSEKSFATRFPHIYLVGGIWYEELGSAGLFHLANIERDQPSKHVVQDACSFWIPNRRPRVAEHCR